MNRALTGNCKSNGAFRLTTLLIIITGVFLCFLSFGLAEYQYNQDMESRSQEVNALNANQALALAQNVNRSFAQADAILQLLKTEMETDRTLNSAYISLMRDFTKTGIFNQIAVADSRGNLLFSALPLNTPFKISDREHFLVLAKEDSGKLYISSPRPNQLAGASSIFLSRRLNDSSGGFAGIVSVGISPDYFAKTIEQMQPGSYTTFLVLRNDGSFLARVPSVDPEEYKSSFKNHPILAKINLGIPSGLFESPGIADGVARLGAFHSLPDYPAFVLVGISKDEAFRLVIARGNYYRTWAVMFSALLGIIFLLLFRQVRKQNRTEETLVKNEARLNNAQSIAHVGDWEIELGNQQVWASAEAFRIYGLEHDTDYLPLRAVQHLVVKEDRAMLDSAIKALLENNAKYDVEFRINRVDNGLERTLHSIAQLQYGTDGKPMKIIGILQDITDRKQAEEYHRRSAQIQSVLREIAEAAALSLSMDELFQTVHRLVGRVLPAKQFQINFLDEAAGEITVPFKADDVSFIPERRPVDKGLTEYIMRLGHASHITPAEMLRLNETGEYTLAKAQNIQTIHYLGAPLIDSHGKVFGVIALIQMGETNAFRPGDVELLSIIAAQVSMAIERKRLEQELQLLAITDGLTGLFNRRHFLSRADEELHRIYRYGGTCALLMADVDHFKTVNDRFGHAVGDTVLQRITLLCRKATRETDLLGRIGGEEFAILLLETDASAALRVADRLRQNIQDEVFFAGEGVLIPLCVSIGIAELHNGRESLSDLMIRADKALYRAKNEGRNRVVKAD